MLTTPVEFRKTPVVSSRVKFSFEGLLKNYYLKLLLSKDCKDKEFLDIEPDIHKTRFLTPMMQENAEVFSKDNTLLEKLSLHENENVTYSDKYAARQDSQETVTDADNELVDNLLRNAELDLTANENILQDSCQIIKSSPHPSIPKFFYPLGPNIRSEQEYLDTIELVEKIFVDNKYEKGIEEGNFPLISIACKIPQYVSRNLFRKISKTIDQIELVTLQDFKAYWATAYFKNPNDESLVFSIIKQDGHKYITPLDINCIAEYIVQTHPGLGFLSNMPVFQEKYIDTVTARIYYTKRHNLNDDMTFSEFKQLKLYEIIKRLESVKDMNSIRDVFSYKHFYVIYCKFWELDSDNDMKIDIKSLQNFEYGSFTHSILQRVIGGCGQGRSTSTKNCMNYKEFIPFILASQEKFSNSGIEYWFRCLDLDGDGLISIYEMQHFWEEQFERMIETGLGDPWKFNDFVCHLFDLLKPKISSAISLHDLKQCGSPSTFFDMLFDLRSYDNQLHRIDPMYKENDEVTIYENEESITLTGWDKYAHKAYEELSAEESQQQGSPVMASEFDDFMDSRDDFVWNDKDEFAEVVIPSCIDDDIEKLETLDEEIEQLVTLEEELVDLPMSDE